MLTAALLITRLHLTDPAEDYIDSFLTQSRIPGMAALIVRPDQPDLRISKGFANLEKKTPIDTKMVFDCGSMNKTLTTVTILRLVEENKINLKDPLGKYVTEVPDEWESATLQQLLSHTAGLPEYVLYPGIGLVDNFDQETWFKTMADKPLDYKPGSEFQYSNTNFFMAMLMAERATKQKWADLLTTYVLKPAKMVETGPQLTQKVIDQRKAQGYWIDESVDEIQQMGTSPDRGSGGHFTTVDDIHLFSDALFTGHLLKPETLKLMTTPAELPKGRKAPYGLGLFVRKVNGVDVWSHGGNSVGYAGSLTYIPAKKTTIVILANAYQMSGDSVALSLARTAYPELNPVAPTESPDPDKTKSEKLVQALTALADRNTDHELFSEEMKARLKRPRGQLSLGSFAPLKDAKYEAYFGSEPQSPDTIVRIKVKTEAQAFLAIFTLDSDGKIFSVSLARA